MGTRYSEAMQKADASRQRHAPGPGANAVDDGAGPHIHLKGIPHLSTERLERSREFHHGAVHTPEGLSAYDGPRAGLVETGLKIKAISHELEMRGHPASTCPLCQS